jgi:hypothetical protein
MQRHFLARTAHKSILAATAVTLVALAAACSSPTSPAAANNSGASLRGTPAPAAHDACGVVAGSDQC